MNIFYKSIYLLFVLIAVFNYNSQPESAIENEPTFSIHKEDILPKNTMNTLKKDSTITKAKIDFVSVNQIKRWIENDLPTIYDYYKQERIDVCLVWSEKLFGRCASNTDLSFTENLFFKITSNIENEKYPISNLSDTSYQTAYVFKEKSEVKISLHLDVERSFLKGKYANKNVLKADEIIMNPIKLSLINGYVKSQEIAYNNGSVKKMKVYVNDEYKETIELLDTPLPQEFMVDAIFRTNDKITLVPVSYYFGIAYDDVCISEIQTNLGKTALPILNEKYNLMKLQQKNE